MHIQIIHQLRLFCVSFQCIHLMWSNGLNWTGSHLSRPHVRFLYLVDMDYYIFTGRLLHSIRTLAMQVLQFHVRVRVSSIEMSVLFFLLFPVVLLVSKDR